MKLNSTVLLTLILLALMLGAGSVSAILGFDIGSKALKGVTTPDARPTTKFSSNNNAQGGLTFLREEEILKTVKSRIEGKTKAAKAEKNRDEDEEFISKKKQEEEKPKEVEENFQAGFPVQAEAEGVTFSVQSAKFSGGDLIMRVKMQNKSQESVRFLYSFLDVTDDKGRALSASTDGLPTELSANGQEASGTISISASLLDDVNQISLALTDYPAQKLRLEAKNIPISR